MTAIVRRSCAGARVSGSYDILVLDASYKQTLACVRSLGRAGLRVAPGECEPLLPALAFHSRHSAHNVVLPSYSAAPSAVADAVVQFVRQYPTRVVLPTGDGTVTALMSRREQLAELGCVLALPPDSALEIALDKDRTLEVARKLDVDQPMTMRIDGVDDLPTAIAEFGRTAGIRGTTSPRRPEEIRPRS